MRVGNKLNETLEATEHPSGLSRKAMRPMAERRAPGGPKSMRTDLDPSLRLGWAAYAYSFKVSCAMTYNNTIISRYTLIATVV